MALHHRFPVRLGSVALPQLYAVYSEVRPSVSFALSRADRIQPIRPPTSAAPRRLPVWVVALLSLLLVAPVQALEPLADRQAQKLVTIGTGDWQPYVKQGRVDAGALGRLIQSVFQQAGYRVRFVFYPWDRNVLMLQKGALDAIMPYACSLERQKFSRCSDPLTKGEVVLFHRKDLAFDWARIEDLKPFTLGTTLGYSYGDVFDQAHRSGQLRSLQASKDDTNLRLLELRRIQLYPQDRAVGYAMLMRLYPGQARVQFTHHPRPLNTETLHLMFRRDDARGAELLAAFNLGLRSLARSGELQRLQDALQSGDPDAWVPQWPARR